MCHTNGLVRSITSQGLRAPTPRPFHGDQGSLQRSLWNPSTRAWRYASPSGLNLAAKVGCWLPLVQSPQPTVRRLDTVNRSLFNRDQPHRGWMATRARPWRLIKIIQWSSAMASVSFSGIVDMILCITYMTTYVQS